MEKQQELYTLSVRTCVCVCVYVCVALVLQHAMRITILSYVACPALQYFSTLSQKQHTIEKKKVTEEKMCVLISSTTFV